MAEKVTVDYTANTSQAVRNIEKYNKTVQKSGAASKLAGVAQGEWLSQIKGVAFGFLSAQTAIALLSFGYAKLTENSRLAAESINRARIAQVNFASESRPKVKGQTSAQKDFNKSLKEGAEERKKEAVAFIQSVIDRKRSIQDLNKEFGPEGTLRGISPLIKGGAIEQILQRPERLAARRELDVQKKISSPAGGPNVFEPLFERIFGPSGLKGAEDEAARQREITNQLLQNLSNDISGGGGTAIQGNSATTALGAINRQRPSRPD